MCLCVCKTFLPEGKYQKYLAFQDFEVYTPANEYNWIDTSSTAPENSHLAVCGKLLTVTFTLPYTEFVPETTQFLFSISGKGLV